MRLRYILILLFAIFISVAQALQAQGPVIDRYNTVEVYRTGFPLENPWTGGIDLPQFSAHDLNYDGIQDLFVFDRASGTPMVFLADYNSLGLYYRYDAELSAMFPKEMVHFGLLYDVDCDGRPDVLTSNYPGIRVYQNIGTNGNHDFVVLADTLLTEVAGFPQELFVAVTDVPGLFDYEGDGDMDILTFDNGGNFMEFHKNMAVENGGSCGLELVRVDQCWGNFQESALNSDITLNTSCRGGAGFRHAGSTVCPLDVEGDGDWDLLLGDLVVNELAFLRNMGNDVMDTAYSGFPAYNVPADMNKFLSAFWIDANLDGQKDLIVAPNEAGAYMNYNNVWFYMDVDTSAASTFSQTDTRFIQKSMIDVGTQSHPAFFDYNNDSLLDLVVGNFNLFEPGGTPKTTLHLYENIGTNLAPKYELISDNWENIAADFVVPVFGVAPTFGDLDGDGDQDMILGGDQGELHYYENTAAPGNNAQFSLATSDYENIDVGNFAMPYLVDIDRDGLLDLVVGETSGNINYFRNVGTATVADFPADPDEKDWGGVDVRPGSALGYSAPVVYEDAVTGKYNLVVGNELGALLYYEDIESQLGGNFSLTRSSIGGLDGGARASVAVADLNGDGRYEWMIGNKRGGLELYSETGIIGRPEAVTPRENGIVAYPNPSEGTLSLRVEGFVKRLQVEVFDVQGRRLRSIEQAGVSGTVELGDLGLDAGLYILRFVREGRPAGSVRWAVTK